MHELKPAKTSLFSTSLELLKLSASNIIRNSSWPASTNFLLMRNALSMYFLLIGSSFVLCHVAVIVAPS